MAVSGVIEHMELDKGLDMVDKAGVGGKKWISQKWLSNETNSNRIYGFSQHIAGRRWPLTRPPRHMLHMCWLYRGLENMIHGLVEITYCGWGWWRTSSMVQYYYKFVHVHNICYIGTEIRSINSGLVYLWTISSSCYRILPSLVHPRHNNINSYNVFLHFIFLILCSVLNIVEGMLGIDVVMLLFRLLWWSKELVSYTTTCPLLSFLNLTTVLQWKSPFLERRSLYWNVPWRLPVLIVSDVIYSGGFEMCSLP